MALTDTALLIHICQVAGHFGDVFVFNRHMGLGDCLAKERLQGLFGVAEAQVGAKKLCELIETVRVPIGRLAYTVYEHTHPQLHLQGLKGS